MTINTTRYSPDTCECTLEYQWDTELPEDQRTHTLTTFVNVCDAHSNLPNDVARWNVIFDENPRKSKSLQTVLELGPPALYDIVDGIRQLKPNVKFDLSWSGVAPDRILTISFPNFSLTQNQKNAIQTALNSKFGAGKVLIA